MRSLTSTLFLMFFLLSTTTHAATVSGKATFSQKPQAIPAPQPVQTAVVDATPPVITITSPALTRGLIARSKGGLTVAGRVTAKNGTASATVNGQAVKLDKNGRFSTVLRLSAEDETVTVSAFDRRGNQATEQFTVAAGSSNTAVAAATPAPAERGKNYALIVGINSYQNQIPSLKTAVNDAKAIAQVLKDFYGYSTTVLIDRQATRAGILKELNRLKNLLNADDRLLLYYAGHGYNDRNTETSYWLPIDADKDDPTNWLEARSVTDQLKRSQAKQVLVVADSCYAGTISRSFDPSLDAKGKTREQYLQKLMEKPSRVLIASGGNEPVSDSGGKGHSIFSDVLLKALKEPFDRRFTAEELMTRQIKESVAGRSEQTLEYKVLRNSGHDGGDFVFVKIR